MTEQTLITPEIFQEMCDQAILAVDRQRWPANASPDDIAGAVIYEIHERVRRHIGEDYEGGHRPLPPNERGIAEIVEKVEKHWSGPILIERRIKETVRLVLEHWRHVHGIKAAQSSGGTW